MIRARQPGAINPLPSSLGRVDAESDATTSSLLPCHLPESPIDSQKPTGRHARRSWTSRRSAWFMTEWLVSAYNYYELCCPKNAEQYEKALGQW
eukprot:4795449-Heterocapsa_arctica.AAC.1